ncbi:MAG: type II toxin-antitoxin system RelB/DinJ family antitoxin [Fretibacterium sp.]|nr:type II toxin-antitoxin system RelB/DinJ family antitoxin [Fretibacterium sp.]
MPKAATVTMRVDESLKRQAEALCEEMGLTLSTAYTMFLKAIVRTRSIPFEVRTEDPFYSESNMARLRHSFQQAEEGNVISKSMVELEAMAANE